MKRILVCLDGSERSPHVLATALDLAGRAGAKVMLFRAVGRPPELPPQLYSVSPSELPKILVKEATRELQKLSKTVDPKLLEGVYAHIGTPWDAICAAAKEQDADLIVIGSHGYSAFDRVLGTTASKVVNHADRSVLVVRPTGGTPGDSKKKAKAIKGL